MPSTQEAAYRGLLRAGNEGRSGRPLSSFAALFSFDSGLRDTENHNPHDSFVLLIASDVLSDVLVRVFTQFVKLETRSICVITYLHYIALKLHVL